jgi:hypothetical protein
MPFDPIKMMADALMPVADRAGHGSDLDGPYLPDLWHTLKPAEQDALVKESKPAFSDDFRSPEDVYRFIQQNGPVQVDPRAPLFDQFIRNAPPDIQRFNYMGDPERTIMLRQKPPLVG